MAVPKKATSADSAGTAQLNSDLLHAAYMSDLDKVRKALAGGADGVRTRDLNKKLASIKQQVAGVDEARAGIKKRDAVAKSRIDQRVNRGMSERSAKLSALHRARRHRLDGRAQELATVHAAERMSLNAAHKAESGKPFARAAGAIFALFDRVPGLRSVIAPLRRNPKLNPTERHRIEREAVERRDQRERLALDRRYKALGRLEARELRSLENAVRRQVWEMEAAREQKAETLQDRIEVNKLDITLPGGELHPADRKGPEGLEGSKGESWLGSRAEEKQHAGLPTYEGRSMTRALPVPCVRFE